MKKYISILSLITVLSMQSCEGNDSDFNEMEQESQNFKISSYKEFAKTENNTSDHSDTNSFQTGDDDDPPRDKQHWKVVNDTIQ